MPVFYPGLQNTQTNQVVYKDASNNPAGSANFTFDGTNATLTGLINTGIKNYSLIINALGNISGTPTINLSNGNYVTATVTGIITSLTFSGQSSTNASGFILELVNGGAYSVAWPISVKWPSATAPTLTVSGTDVLVFVSDDNGTTWRGVLSMADSR